MSKKYAQMLKEYPLITFFIVWCLVVCTYVVWRVFGDNPPDIPAGTAAAFGTFFALPALAIQMMKYRHKDKDE